MPFYFLYATIHSNEVGNGQAIIEIVHRLATEDSPEIREILENTVLLLVPSQNPDGQILMIDHWYDTRGTSFGRIYPDLYHRYAGHDDNRDWFMFTQKETRLAIDIHRQFKPQVTHDMHQMGWDGARIFVPPFRDPYDPNIHPLLIKDRNRSGWRWPPRSSRTARPASSTTTSTTCGHRPASTCCTTGKPRILTEIASANLADPLYNPAGAHRPLGPQQARSNFPAPFDRGVWRLADIVEYGRIAVFAGLEQVAKYRIRWLENFYRVHRDWVSRNEPPYAFVVPAGQRDPYETYQLLEILHTGEVEIHRARAPFAAGGQTWAAGSWVIPLAQPYGAFAKTMLERQVYPDLRYYPGGPPIPPYDVTGHTLGLLMGVDTHQIDEPFRADLELLEEIAPPRTALPPRPDWAYTLSPASNAAFLPLPSCRPRACGCFAPRKRPTRPAAAAGWSRAPGSYRPPAQPSGSWTAWRPRPDSSSRRPPSHRPWTASASRIPRASACGASPTTCPAAGCCGSSNSTASTTAWCRRRTSGETWRTATTSSCCPPAPPAAG